jgi:hypothetical protein
VGGEERRWRCAGRPFVIHPDTNSDTVARSPGWRRYGYLVSGAVLFTHKVEIRPTKRPRSKSTIGLHPDTVTALRQRRDEQAAERQTMGALRVSRGWVCRCWRLGGYKTTLLTSLASSTPMKCGFREGVSID